MRASIIVHPVLLILLGCVTFGQSEGASGKPVSDWMERGTLVVAHEELYLVPEGQDARVSLKNCTTLTPGLSGRASGYARYNWKHVVVWGRAVPWPGGSTVFIKFGRDRVRNGCSSEKIVIIDKISSL